MAGVFGTLVGGTALIYTLAHLGLLAFPDHRLPEFSHWLRQPIDRRRQDVNGWLDVIRPLCDAVTEMLWLIRESAQPQEKTAINGMYQHRMQKDASCRLLRVTLPQGSKLYPEISGSQHRFTIRFLEWSTIKSRAVQTGHDVKFKLSIC